MAGLLPEGPREGTGPLVHRQAEHLVLDAELFLLELVEKHVVGVGSPLFGIDLSLKSGMLGCEGLDVCFFHWCHSRF